MNYAIVTWLRVVYERSNREAVDGGKCMKGLLRKMNRRSAQSLVEYALILALIAVVAILVLRGIGTAVNTKLTSVNANLQP